MKRSILFGIFSSFIGLICLVLLFAAGSNLPVSQWPFEAFQGLVFTLVWGMGVPESLGYLVSGITVLMVLAVFFAAGKRLSRLFLKNS
ncbi:MAG: hypothetical protein ABJM19_15840 [Marinobacter sp.]|uniref:hypothetical protein n=1 Tax=Marinobacter sp. TaxID=50741 RepID=UPI00329A27C5